MAKKKNFYFIHIRKVAGTSVRSYLLKNFSKDEICPELSQFELFAKHKRDDIGEYLSKFKLVAGHYFELPRFFEKERFVFTILREPVARVISEVNQIRNDERDLLHQKAKLVTHREMLYIPDFLGSLENLQTRYLVENSGKKYESLSDSERLSVAKEYLDSIDFFGLTENLVTTLFMLSEAAGFNPPTKLHVTNTEITRNSLTISDFLQDIERVHELNQLDFELYKHAKRKFQERALTYLTAVSSLEQKESFKG